MLRFTEHALFRYCQRVLGADVTWLKESLSAQLGDIPGDGAYKLSGYDAYAIVKDGMVMTVMTERQLKESRSKSRKLRFKEAKEDY